MYFIRQASGKRRDAELGGTFEKQEKPGHQRSEISDLLEIHGRIIDKGGGCAEIDHHGDKSQGERFCFGEKINIDNGIFGVFLHIDKKGEQNEAERNKPDKAEINAHESCAQGNGAGAESKHDSAFCVKLFSVKGAPFKAQCVSKKNKS